MTHDDIQFGELEQEGPQEWMRPDRDPRLAVVLCGQHDDGDMPIFVDLDVMRDMEAHARTNTRVELGGVLLGGKHVDDEGNAFIVVTESIRAEHYEATQASFKFTHETWAAITRQRSEMPDGVGLVGWYHTHPDFGIFLSGMDMFICDNFFADDLDVALVIDPCRGERGWFHWSDAGDGRRKRRVAGFSLFASRFRRAELLHFARELAGSNPTYTDSRYDGFYGDGNMQPVVNLQNQQSVPLTLGIAGMLFIQTLVMALIAWRVVVAPAESGIGGRTAGGGEAYRDVLGELIGDENVTSKIFDNVEQLGAENDQLKTSVAGQSLLIDEVTRERDAALAKLEKEKKTLAIVRTKLSEEEAAKSELEQQVDRLEADLPKNGLTWLFFWIVTASTGVLALVLGGIGGWFLKRALDAESAAMRNDDER